jgi:hypothetical protein
MEGLTWRTQEYLHREKTADWYWIVGIVTISIALIAIILNNVIFAILIIVSSITLSLFASRPPEIVEVSLNKHEIKYGIHTYPYKTIESYWVETRDNHNRILLKTQRRFSPLVVIFIDEVEPEMVENYLSHHIQEKELSEPLLEKLLIYLGF